MGNLIPEERIENRIFVIRGQKVMIDRDLAELYGVKTKRLNEQVKRNIKRFPDDFMFQLTKPEADKVITICYQLDDAGLRSQFATSKRGGRRNLPYVFTEQGVAMLSSVLNSEQAIQINIIIMRTFVKIKQFLSNHKDLQRKLDILEERMEKRYSKHDEEIQLIFNVIRKLMLPPEKSKKKIGYI